MSLHDNIEIKVEFVALDSIGIFAIPVITRAVLIGVNTLSEIISWIFLFSTNRQEERMKYIQIYPIMILPLHLRDRK